MTTKKVEQPLPPLPEAPASVNFKGVTQGGFVCQWTLRDVDENKLLERQIAYMQMLKDGGVQPYPVSKPTPLPLPSEVEPDLPNADPGWCKLHNVGMTERTAKDGSGDTWFSHKHGDAWCTGKEA